MEGVIKKFLLADGRYFEMPNEEFLPRGETRFVLLYILIVGTPTMT
jgi:hypothetical protein